MKLAIRKTVSKAKVLQGPHRQYSKTDTIRDCFSRKVAEIGRSSPKKNTAGQCLQCFGYLVGAQRLELWTDGLRVRCSTN